MNAVHLAFLAALLAAPFAAADARAACDTQPGGPLQEAAYCGRYSPGGGGAAAPDNRAACSFYVAPSGGSDSNVGSSAAPFATLSKLQTVVRGVGGQVACLKAGTYSNVAITVTSADNGETWETDKASGINTAVLDGAGTNYIFSISGVNVFTINGIKVQNCGSACIMANVFSGSPAQANNVTVENSDLSGTNGTGAGAGNTGGVLFQNVTNAKISNNYFHGMAGVDLALMAFNAGDSVNGGVISGNVALGACQVLSDCGAIYLNERSGFATAGAVTITNNFVRDYGSSSLTADMVGIYLDDQTSGVTVTGNIVGPPTVGAPNNGNANNTAAFLLNGGGNNVLSGNLVDLGGSALVSDVVWGAGSGAATNAGSEVTGNIFISRFSGPSNSTASGNVGFAYWQPEAAADYTISHNVYFNYGGGAAPSNGTAIGDGSPQSFNPQITGYLYAIAAGSAVFLAPTNFPPVVGAWGPPGFIIPTSSNHSN